MEYSFVPHTLYNPWIAFAILFCILYPILVIVGLSGAFLIDKEDYVEPKFFISLIVCSLIITNFIIEPFKDRPHPENLQVVATKVKTGITQTGGKYSTDQMFVAYRVPEGDVSFKMVSGHVYPDEIILYRK